MKKSNLKAYKAIEKMKPGQIAIMFRKREEDPFVPEDVHYRFVTKLSNGNIKSEWTHHLDVIDHLRGSLCLKPSCFDYGGPYNLHYMMEFDQDNDIELELIGVL